MPTRMAWSDIAPPLPDCKPSQVQCESSALIALKTGNLYLWAQSLAAQAIGLSDRRVIGSSENRSSPVIPRATQFLIPCKLLHNELNSMKKTLRRLTWPAIVTAMVLFGVT